MHTHTLTPHQRLAGHRCTREPRAPGSSCSSRSPPQDVLLELPGQGAYTAGLQPHAGSLGLAQQYKQQPSPTPKRINSGGKLVRNGCTYPGAGTLTVTSEEVTHCSPRSLRRGDEHSMTQRCGRESLLNEELQVETGLHYRTARLHSRILFRPKCTHGCYFNTLFKDRPLRPCQAVQTHDACTARPPPGKPLLRTPQTSLTDPGTSPRPQTSSLPLQGKQLPPSLS